MMCYVQAYSYYACSLPEKPLRKDESGCLGSSLWMARMAPSSDSCFEGVLATTTGSKPLSTRWLSLLRRRVSLLTHEASVGSSTALTVNRILAGSLQVVWIEQCIPYGELKKVLIILHALCTPVSTFLLPGHWLICFLGVASKSTNPRPYQCLSWGHMNLALNWHFLLCSPQLRFTDNFVVHAESRTHKNIYIYTHLNIHM